METADLIQLYKVLVVGGTFVTCVVAALYGFVAPWHRNYTGIAFFGLLASLSLLLLNSSLGLFFAGQVWRIYTGITLFSLYLIFIIAIGVLIYKAQIVRYPKKDSKQKANK